MQLIQIREETNGITSNNAYTRFSCNYSFLAANSFYITPGKPQETSPNNYDFASDPADATGDPVNLSDSSGMVTCPSGLPGCGVVTDVQNKAANIVRSGVNVITGHNGNTNSKNDTTLLIDWILGIHTVLIFNQSDPMTQSLMRDGHQWDVIEQERKDLANGGPYVGENDYEDPRSISAVFNDFNGFLTNGGVGSNNADAFLGSYQELWWAQPNGSCTAKVSFLVLNKTDLNSLAHPEYFTNGLIKSIDGLSPIYGGLLLRDPFAFRPQFQQFSWQETLGY